MKPQVSIIVPAYNEEKNLKYCLRSLVSQKTKINYEVILIDNNSNDKTYEIGKRFDIKVVKEKRQGRAYAHQKGVEVANGNILAFTDADCIVPDNWVEFIFDYFNKHHSIIGLVGGYRFVGSTLILTIFTPLVLFISSWLFKVVYGIHAFRGTNFAVRKSIFKKIRFNPFVAPFDEVDLSLQAKRFGSIHFLANFTVKSSDRRFRNRLLKYLVEFIYSYSRIFILKKKGNENFYANIR